MNQFVIWQLHGVMYLCLQENPEDPFVTPLRRLDRCN